MKVVFQTSINSLRQKEQAIVKDGWQKIGIETEIKSVDAGVFFSSDPGNPDIFARFSVDTQMFTSTFDSPFPVGYMNRFYTGANPDRTWGQKSNNWSGPELPEVEERRVRQAVRSGDGGDEHREGRDPLAAVNDLVVKDFASVPLVDRKFASGKAKTLTGPAPRAFDNETWNIADWKKG